jgi:hypothetical protein
VDTEIVNNNNRAAELGLTYFNPANMVTPGITGLNDDNFVNRAVANGIQFVVTDTSVLNSQNNGPNPSPNVGLVNTINSGLYMIPRHANNLFFNVATPEGWTEEYQCIYTGQAPYNTYSYTDILDNISRSFVSDMLKGDMDPQMFHQPNLVAYDGTRSLIGDLYDSTFNLYFNVFTYNQSGVTATWLGGAASSISITVPSGSAVSSAVIPVTGLNTVGAEQYGGQNISHVQVNRGQTVVVPMP